MLYVIFNPNAGRGTAARHESEVRAALDASGLSYAFVRTEGVGHAERLAATAAERDAYTTIMAAGGDGTINEVVNGIARTGTALAVLPLGTGNVWVRELRLPLRPRDAAIALSMGHTLQLDLGLAEQRYFLLMAGVGFDAVVTRAVDPQLKRRLGMLAYIVQALRAARDVRGTRARLTLDGRVVKGRVLMVVIGNSRLYGGVLEITHHANLTDGLLDIAVIKGQDVRSAPLHLLSILLRRYHLNPDMAYYRAREVRIESAIPLGVHVDGDPLGTTPMTFRVAPAALRALVPPWISTDVIATGPGLRLPVMDRIRRILIDRSQHRP